MGETHWREGKSFLLPCSFGKASSLAALPVPGGFCAGETRLRLLGRNRHLPQKPCVPSITLCQQLAESCWPGGAGGGSWGCPSSTSALLEGLQSILWLWQWPKPSLTASFWLFWGEDEEEGALQPRWLRHRVKFLLCCEVCAGLVPCLGWVQELVPGLSPAKDGLSIL